MVPNLKLFVPIVRDNLRSGYINVIKDDGPFPIVLP